MRSKIFKRFSLLLKEDEQGWSPFLINIFYFLKTTICHNSNSSSSLKTSKYPDWLVMNSSLILPSYPKEIKFMMPFRGIETIAGLVAWRSKRLIKFIRRNFYFNLKAIDDAFQVLKIFLERNWEGTLCWIFLWPNYNFIKMDRNNREILFKYLRKIKFRNFECVANHLERFV